jgi:hypothetical protein
MDIRIVIILIILALATSERIAVASDEKNIHGDAKLIGSTVSKKDKSLCKRIGIMVNNRTTSKYMPKSENTDPHTTRYLNLDIDNDGRADDVTVNSGSSESLLVVKLSTGEEYDLDESLMYLIKLNGKVYAVVRLFDWSVLPGGQRAEKDLGHRLYILTKDKAELACDTNDLK